MAGVGASLIFTGFLGTSEIFRLGELLMVPLDVIFWCPVRAEPWGKVGGWGIGHAPPPKTYTNA